MPTGIYVRSEAQKRNISAGMMGKQNRLGGHVSDETKAKISATMTGRPNPHRSHPYSEVARARTSVAMKGNTNGLGHCYICSKETRAKLSIVMTGNNWKGGPQVFRRRSKAKRRVLGFIPLNQPFEGCNGHHVDRERVVYIPEVLHMSIRHNVWNGHNMDKINAVAFDYLSKQEVAQ